MAPRIDWARLGITTKEEKIYFGLNLQRLLDKLAIQMGKWRQGTITQNAYDRLPPGRIRSVYPLSAPGTFPSQLDDADYEHFRARWMRWVDIAQSAMAPHLEEAAEDTSKAWDFDLDIVEN
jgi:hypothetical protein